MSDTPGIYGYVEEWAAEKGLPVVVHLPERAEGDSLEFATVFDSPARNPRRFWIGFNLTHDYIARVSADALRGYIRRTLDGRYTELFGDAPAIPA